MGRQAERSETSSILPRELLRRAGRLAEARLPVKWWDGIIQFWVQTQLVFSRSTLMLAGGLLLFFYLQATGQMFNAATGGSGQAGNPDSTAFVTLFMLGQVLAIMLNMNLWQAEREGRTYELLLMRVPSIHHLIWLKLRVTLIWLIIFPAPLYAGYAWFLDIAISRMLLYWLFATTGCLLTAVLTCVVSSFVRHGLTTGIIAAAVAIPFAVISTNAPLPYHLYYAAMLDPFGTNLDGLRLWKYLRILIVNRLIFVAVGVALYWWLHTRLQKTEDWVV